MHGAIWCVGRARRTPEVIRPPAADTSGPCLPERGTAMRLPHLRIQRLHLFVAFLVLACTGCASSRVPCDEPSPDTSGWRPHTSYHGGFTVVLPRGATEKRPQCFDSGCGTITVVGWRLGYDYGRMAGSGDSVRVHPGDRDVTRCAVEIGGRPGNLLTARRAGGWAGRAAVPLSDWNGGLYLFADSLSDTELREFLAAVRSVRIGAELLTDPPVSLARPPLR